MFVELSAGCYDPFVKKMGELGITGRAWECTLEGEKDKSYHIEFDNVKKEHIPILCAELDRIHLGEAIVPKIGQKQESK